MCLLKKEIIRICEQVREMCEVRDRCVTSILNEESDTIIDFFMYILSFTSVFYLKCALQNANKELQTTKLVKVCG